LAEIAPSALPPDVINFTPSSSKETIFRLSIDEFSNLYSLLTFHQDSKEAVHMIHKVPYEKQPSQLRRHKRPQHKVAMP